MILEEYLDAEYASAVNHRIVHSVRLVRKITTRFDGYLRFRCELINHDFLEVALRLTLNENTLKISSYRYQWMDSTQTQLRRRWDDAPHFPHLPNFPHHCHIGDEEIVQPSDVLHVTELLDLIELMTERQ